MELRFTLSTQDVKLRLFSKKTLLVYWSLADADTWEIHLNNTSKELISTGSLAISRIFKASAYSYSEEFMFKNNDQVGWHFKLCFLGKLNILNKK